MEVGDARPRPQAEDVDAPGVVAVAVVARGPDVGHDGDAGLVHPGPEGIEVRVSGVARSTTCEHCAGPHHQDARVARERPLELLARPADIRQRDVG